MYETFCYRSPRGITFLKKSNQKTLVILILRGATVFHCTAAATASATAFAFFFVFSHLKNDKSDYNGKNKNHCNCSDVLSDKFH